METVDQKTARLIEEKQLLTKAMNNPGTQLILQRLTDFARASLVDYDDCRFSTEEGREMAQRIQARRYVILKEIPNMIEEIVNVDIPREGGKRVWRFGTWLESTRENVKRYFWQLHRL